MRIRPLRAAAFVAALGAAAPVLAEEMAEGQAIWSSACARCHRDPAALLRGLEPGAAARAAELDVFLARHRAPDPAKRAALIDWLLSLGGE
ncbi:hypothetical protein [Amaricoccus solimangrovi]|uniref:Cytochrome c domain-containing protein n=1 Tax=Amaricoccus solimangrovi TaxID=2589815 RepID=A0A501WWX2_9RHOB|nr:hypothetical protein [Amaricoccus solimangrovi]TPE51441.1 hypothetical protein FJM51_09385 [Amaricoccus solimangrovi]